MNPPLSLFVTPPDPSLLLSQAQESSDRWMRGKPLSVLDGVIVPIKSEIDVMGNLDI